jgi:hypothetical protein
MASTIRSTASLHVFALANSSAGSMKLPVCLRLRAGSMGRTLNAANAVSFPAIGVVAIKSFDALLAVGLRGEWGWVVELSMLFRTE